MKQIKVKIGLDGSVEVDAVGFKGQGCKKATKPIEEALGMQTATKQKPEAFVSEHNPNQQSQSYGW